MSEDWNDQGAGAGGQQGPSQQSGGFDPRYSQTPYGQQDPNNQYGQQYPNSQYGQQYPQQGQYAQQYPPTNGPYAQQSQQQQQWAQNQPMYGTPYGYAAPPPANRSAVLGVIGLGIVLLATVALVVAAWTFGQGLGQYLLEVASTGIYMDENELVNNPLTQQYAESAAGVILAIVMASLVGLAGWIVSIVATVQRRGRGFGIGGIVLGVLSWGFGYAAFMAAMAPVFNMLGR